MQIRKRVQITLAIVTKNRASKLRRLLSSIANQEVTPELVMVIDNDKEFSARPVVDEFMLSIPLKYLNEQKQGVPYARNKALKYTTTPYLAFIDDDCVMEARWVKNAQFIASMFPSVTYFVGKSLLLNEKSQVAVAQYLNQTYWFHKKLQKKYVTTGFNVDTKNILLHVSQLKKKRFTFDTKMSEGWFDCSDTDMGFFLERQQAVGVFFDRLIVWHEESESVYSYLKKGFYRGKLARRLSEKWGIEGEFVYVPFTRLLTYIKALRFWPKEYNEYLRFYKKTTYFVFFLFKAYERVFLWGYCSK